MTCAWGSSCRFLISGFSMENAPTDAGSGATSARQGGETSMWLKLADRLAGMGGGPSGSAHMLGSCRYRIVAAALAAAVVILVAPAGANAAPPKITSAPVIRGTAQVAGTLTASAVWTGQPEPTAAWQWLRCA